jgi:hypothetical protein
MKSRKHVTIGILLATSAALALAQKPIAYPARGQSSAQQGKDDAACYSWAKNSTGIDPATLAANPPPQETGPAVGGGERAQGAARGALGGAAIGAIAGDTGKGAGAGAVLGTMRGGQRARANQATRNDQRQGQQQQALDTYNRAWGACMSGRGYTVS